MTEEMEKLIDLYYEDSIELTENRQLCFKRISEYRRTERQAVKVSIDDLDNGTSIELGIYFDAVWKFSSPMNERTFWQQVKSYTPEFREIFDRLRMKVPGREFHAYKIRFGQFSGRSSSHVDKLTTIFKSELDGPNV
jgi:hypothetical protein